MNPSGPSKDPSSEELKDPLSDPLMAFGKIDEHRYKAELDLVDRYQAFVAELLRLSLGGIAVFGFMYEKVFSKLCSTSNPCLVAWAKGLAATGIVALSMCAACALVFRYSATEGARYYIEALRFLSEDNRDSLTDKIKHSRRSLERRDGRISVCIGSKILAACFLGLGGLSIAVSFCLLLFSNPAR